MKSANGQTFQYFQTGNYDPLQAFTIQKNGKTTAQRLKEHLDTNGKAYYEPIRRDKDE